MELGVVVLDVRGCALVDEPAGEGGGLEAVILLQRSHLRFSLQRLELEWCEWCKCMLVGGGEGGGLDAVLLPQSSYLGFSLRAWERIQG